MIGIIALIKALPSTSVIDRIAFWVRAMLNDLLRYMALRRKVPYKPPPKTYLYPVASTWPFYKTFASLGGYFVLCVATIAIVERV